MLWLNLAIFVILLIVGFFYQSHTTHKLATFLTKRSEITENEIVQVLTPQLFYIDNKAIKHTADVFLASGRLSGIQITSDTDGIIIDKPSTARSILPVKQRSIVYNGHKLGIVKLWFDDREIRDAQKQTISIMIIVMAVTAIANAIVISLILRSVLSNPLTLLQSRIEELASGSFEVALPPVPHQNLNLIMVAVNNMAQQLSRKTRQLAESEEKYREIFNATGEAIFIHDASTGKILEVNDTTLKMYGYRHDEVSRLSVGDLSAGKEPYTEQEAIFLVDKAVNEGPQIFEWLAQRKDGECFWVEVSLQSTSIGGKGRVLAVVRDITLRKESENELLREKAFTEAIINSLPGIFFVYDENLRLIQWNKEHEKLTGFSADELRNKYGLDWVDEYEKTKMNQALQHLSEKGSVVIPDTYILIKNGRKLPVYISASQVNFEDNKLLVGIGIDISKQKKIEEELRQAQKMEAIGTLAGGIAHDFNNILTPIYGYVELALMKTSQDPQLSQYLREVQNAATRAREMVKQILTFSKRDSEKISPIDVHMIVKEALKLLRASIPTTIEMRQTIDPQSGWVRANPTQIHQILMNLCTNAYYAMRETGGILGVSLIPLDYSDKKFINNLNMKSGPYLRLEVSDTGHGIDKITQERIFEPYFTTKTKGEGTGMGLSVVHGIIKGLGGHITVYSESGEGTTFHVFLPVIENSVSQPKAFPEGSIPTGTERILLVDDDETVRNVEREMLTSLGYDVKACSDSLETLSYFTAQPDMFDLVITDMTMPKMTGDKLAQEIMAIRPDMPVILCTGFSDLIKKEDAKAIGIREYVTKPIILQTFGQTVRNVLDGDGE